jgi:hypothetical protein
MADTVVFKKESVGGSFQRASRPKITTNAPVTFTERASTFTARIDGEDHHFSLTDNIVINETPFAGTVAQACELLRTTVFQPDAGGASANSILLES